MADGTALHYEPREKFSAVPEDHPQFAPAKRQQEDGGSLSIIGKYCTSLCCDIRDKVYGLLGLIDGVTLEVDYGLSTLGLFTAVMQICPAQLAHELASSLLTALELSPASILNVLKHWPKSSLTPSMKSTHVIPIKIEQRGRVVKEGKSLIWSEVPNRPFLVNIHRLGVVEEEDEVYSFLPASVNIPRTASCFLIVLRVRQYQHSGPGLDSSKPSKIFYDVVGTVEPITLEQCTDSFVTTSLLGASAFRDIGRSAWGPMAIEIPLVDFITLDSVFELRRSAQKWSTAAFTDSDCYLNDRTDFNDQSRVSKSQEVYGGGLVPDQSTMWKLLQEIRTTTVA